MSVFVNTIQLQFEVHNDMVFNIIDGLFSSVVTPFIEQKDQILDLTKMGPPVSFFTTDARYFAPASFSSKPGRDLHF